MASDVLRVKLGSAGLAAGASEGTPKLEVAAVYDAHCDYVFRCLRSLGVSPSQLEDAVQDVFVVVHQKLADFDGACALRTWLYAIVIRVARKKRTALARAWAEEVESASTHCTEQEAAKLEGLALAQRALAALDADKREVFVLLEIEQMSAPEVAQVLSLPVNTVYARLRLARLSFNRELERLTREKPSSTPRGRHG